MNKNFGRFLSVVALVPSLALAEPLTSFSDAKARLQKSASQTTSEVKTTTEETKQAAGDQVKTETNETTHSMRDQGKTVGRRQVQRGADAATKKVGNSVLGKGVAPAQGAANIGVDKGVDAAAAKIGQ